jgi:hypothetical protein
VKSRTIIFQKKFDLEVENTSKNILLYFGKVSANEFVDGLFKCIRALAMFPKIGKHLYGDKYKINYEQNRLVYKFTEEDITFMKFVDRKILKSEKYNKNSSK